MGVEDLKTEVGFNGSYAGERYQINLVNKLLADGRLPAEKYHHIEMCELQRGYFDYVFESMDVFDEVGARATKAFQGDSSAWIAGGPRP